MDYCSFKHDILSISIFFLIILTHNYSVTALTICINNGNYTQRSTYSTNLNRVVSSLSTNINNTGFYYNSFGQNPDQVNAYVLCRADVSLDTCKNCTETALSEIQSTCPNYKQAVTWEEFCTLKYANDTMYGQLETGYKYFLWNPSNATSPVQFRQDLRNLLDDLRSKASSGGNLMKVAVGNVSGPDFQTIFGLVQCKPDLSPEDCTSCLINAARDIPRYCDGKIGCRVMLESCFLRYESDPFYNETRVRELTVPVSVPVTAPETPPKPPITSPPPPPAGSTNGDNKTRTVIIIVVVASIVVLAILVVTGCFISRKRRKPQPAGVNIDEPNADEVSTVESLQYDFGKIKTATNDFSDENKLGRGGFGVVYKGKLANGQEIAVKRLSRNSGQGDLEFKNEVLLLARLQHRNLVRLLGFSLEGAEKLLVYEFVQNASLDQFIFDPVKRFQLDWDKRSKIIGGIARGILYLHEDSRLRIIHRDLKASNVLLDSEMAPKIADFGMARLFVQDDQTQGSTSRIVGTYGYMSPEYAMHGQFSVKSDVFSFGVLVLEIISGQKNNCFRDGDSIQDLLSFAWRNWREGTAVNVIDPILKSSSGSVREMLRCIHVGLLCVQENMADRPTMASVVLMLSSLSMTLPVPSEPAFFVPGSGYDLEMNSNARESEKKDTSSNKSIVSNHDLSKNDVSITELYPR